jgi:hypothetical protein
MGRFRAVKVSHILIPSPSSDCHINPISILAGAGDQKEEEEKRERIRVKTGVRD